MLLADEHGPIIDLLTDTLLTPEQLSARWQLSAQALANLRRARRGVPYIKLSPSGFVRDRRSGIVKAEMAGIRGPVTPDVVRMSLTGIAAISPATRETVARRIENLIKCEARM